MKKLLSFSMLAAILFLTSCKKEHPGPSIMGLWIGTYEVVYGHEPTGPLYYSFAIQSDRKILVQSLGADGNTYYGEGTWNLSGSDFTASITTMNLGQAGVVQNVTAKYHPNSRKLQGEVENAGGDYKATFVLEKTD
jgi:hypothetical protein